MHSHIWIDRRDMPTKQVNDFILSKNNRDTSTCNTLKVTITACDIKCETRGLLLCASNKLISNWGKKMRLCEPNFGAQI